MDTTEDGAESSISPSPTTSISSLSWASSTSTEAHTWQPLCLFRFLRPPPPTPPPQYHARVIRGTLTRSSEKFTKYRHENLDRQPLTRRKSQQPNKLILAPVKENLGTSAPELNEVLRTIQEAWPRQRSRSSVSRREPRGEQDRHPRTSCGCREEEGGQEDEEEGEEEEDEEEEEEGGVSSEEGDMGSSCRSGKAAEDDEAKTGAAAGQPFLPHQLPRRRYSVPEVIIRKFRLAAEEQWGANSPGPFPQATLPPQPLTDEWPRKTWRGVGDSENATRKVTYQNRGSQIGGRLTYFGEPDSERLEIAPPPPPESSSPPPQHQVMSLIPRYSAIPRSDSMSVNVGGDGGGLAAAPPPPPIALQIVSKGAESEDCSLVDSLEDEAVVMARRNQARAAKTMAAPPEESPTKVAKPQTPLVGGEAFFVAIGSSSPATSISFSGSSPSPCSSEKHKQPERIKKASMSVGPETVSAMPKRLRDRLAQRHRRLLQKMERQRNQRKKAEEMALAKKTGPKPPRSRSLSKAPAESQSKPSQTQRRVPLGQSNRTSTSQPGGRVAKPQGASGSTPASKGGTPLRTRGGTFQQKFKCIPEDRSLHLGSSSSSTPPSSLSASSNSEEEEVEVDVISVEAGSETDAARLRPRLRSENAKKLGGRNKSRSSGPRHGGLKQSKPQEVGPPELQTIKEESKGSVETENEGKESAVNKEQADDNADNNSVNKENEVQVTAVPLNDSNNNMHYSVDLQGKRVDLVSESGDTNIVIKVEQNGEAQLEGAPPPPPPLLPKSGSDDDSRSSKSSSKSSIKRGSLRRQKTTESASLLTDHVSHKGKVALGIENNNEEDLVSLSCGWLNFYLMHADLKSSCEEDDSKSLKREERVKEPRREREIKPQKTITRIATHSRHTKASPDLSAPDTNGSGFPTKLPQIVSPENSPPQETVQLTNPTHHRSRLPRPLQTSRVQNPQNALVPINNPSPIVARPTHLSFLPNPNRMASDSSHAPQSSSPTSPSSSQPNDRTRHRHQRRRKGRDVEWGAEASTGTQTGESAHGWSVTIAGSCPQPDVEMRLTFPAPNGRSRCSGSRGRQHQSDSGLGEENGMGRDRQGRTGGPTGQHQASLLPSSVPPQEPPETWLLTLRNESTNPGGALEEDRDITEPNPRLKQLKCLPDISYQPPNQDAGTKNRANKVTVRANRASSLRFKSAHPGVVPAFLDNNATTPIAEKGDTNKSLSMLWPKVRRALEQKHLDQNDRDTLCNEINAMAMILGTKEKVPIYRMAHGRTKLEIHGSALPATDNSREMEKMEVRDYKSKASKTEWKNSQMHLN